MKTFLALAILLVGYAFASAQTEQAPLLEKEINYKDWTYKNVRDDKSVNLRDSTNGKKLLLVVYFAPWCPNWKHEAPFAQKLYEKYKKNGLDVIGVGEYDTVAAMKTNLDTFKITFPVVYESDVRDAKQKTLHYEYRKAVGDTRGWGSPWNIFIEPTKIEKKGDVLVKKAFIVNGELIEAEAEKFVRQKLGLPAQVTKAENVSKIVEVCEPIKNALTFAKP
ncbi:MAG: TlpA family protein disulfide reductase [Acidobacteria bacterium]|jgi:thiol-disulfide isomerase/thioredoxin|nr:TlpA family protein disulfide reductase [Acidobacteriota bacterium]